MKKLLSLPPNLVGCFHQVTGKDAKEWYCQHDPIGRKVGSGGGTTWLLQCCHHDSGTQIPFQEWLAQEKRIILHAGGQSRRLPSYAPSGKILTPIPVFRWERGQRLSQDLLDIQVSLYERIMNVAPPSLHTMVVSGDVFIRATEPLQTIPDADVVCYGLWLSPDIAKDHGVFVADRAQPAQLKQMLQKPSLQQLGELLKDHFYLTDIGIWLLSDRAVQVLMRKSMSNGQVTAYDLYSQFGCALGTNPTITDPEVSQLSVAILSLPGGEFYHYGTTHEMITSTVSIQNLVQDQRRIIHHDRKPHPTMFIQNAEVWTKVGPDNQSLWIENSCVSERWKLQHHHVITGVPENAWDISLMPGQCVDVVPIGDSEWVARPYGFDDIFRGAIDHPETRFIQQPMTQWLTERNINPDTVEGKEDMQTAKIFPVVYDLGDLGLVLRWMLNEPYQGGGRLLWNMSRKMSAEEISAEANIVRLTQQRNDYRAHCWPFLAKNYQHSVFYQLDLDDAAQAFANHNIALPTPLPEDEPLLTRMHDAMFRAKALRLKGLDGDVEERKAFALLRDGLTAKAMATRQQPRRQVLDDQIVWGRSPVRIDIAGGWSDTPPYCLLEGGQVLNIAIQLNGQPPIQTFIKPTAEPHIVIRSIDLGATEVVTTYEQLANYHLVGSPFSIPKAALSLAGFLPQFAAERFDSLQQQLENMGGGMEITLLSAIPAGSGLGTSSILAATVLGALNDYCGLAWDKMEIGRRTLVLEQLLTTGGGWQDQYGGLLQGVKLLATERGFNQEPIVKWVPDALYTLPEYKSCHLLYYTGITRTAKTILAEIVRGMFLNQHDQLRLLREIKDHAMEVYEAFQHNNFEDFGKAVRTTWMQKQAIDSGTNPPDVERITQLIDDYCLGYQLPGAGGGGFLYMVAKDPDAAARIRQTLSANYINNRARFVEMTLCKDGFQLSRS